MEENLDDFVEWKIYEDGLYCSDSKGEDEDDEDDRSSKADSYQSFEEGWIYRDFRYSDPEKRDWCEGYLGGYYGHEAEYGPDGAEAKDLNGLAGEVCVDTTNPRTNWNT